MRRLIAGLALLVACSIANAATVFVSEFQGPPTLAVYYQAANAPETITTTAAIGAGSLQVPVFNSTTRLIRVHCDVACHIAIGTSPTATTSSMRLAAGQTEYFVIPPATAYRLAVIAGT